MTRYSIELDCPPGNPRPGDLIHGVLKDTPFTEADFETGKPFFGHQTWVLVNHAKDAEYLAWQDIFKERITSLYNMSVIRYGSW